MAFNETHLDQRCGLGELGYQSFNDNIPWDNFVLWQLAGDLLPNATQEQILATAFNRLHQQENEGGSVAGNTESAM